MSTLKTQEGRASSIKGHETHASNVSGQRASPLLYRYNTVKSLFSPLSGRNLRRFMQNSALAESTTRLAAIVNTNSGTPP